MKKCSNCNAPLEDEALFCSECGAKQTTPEIKCPNCGEVLTSNAKFCINCGTTVGENAGDVVKQSEIQTTDDCEITQPDENTLSFNIQGIPFNMKFIRGGMVGNTELSDFYIGETLVTQALWHMVMESNPSTINDNINYPVCQLSHQTANRFLTRLKKLTGVTFDIPTSSQIRYITICGCKGMSKKQHEEIRWGDKKIHAVCKLEPDKFGLYDTADRFGLVIDKYPQESCYQFNPKYEEGEYYSSSFNCDKEPYIGKYKKNLEYNDYNSNTLRLVINIPVDDLIEKKKKIHEKKEIELEKRKKELEKKEKELEKEREKKEKELEFQKKYRGYHDFVDLGLPSGLKWATCNIGASSPEKFGDYFAWGETESKMKFNSNPIKYIITLIPNYKLEPKEDAAYHLWGDNWRTPTKDDFEELISNCELERVEDKGVAGYKLMSKINGKSIFFPAASYIDGEEISSHFKDGCCYMSSSSDSKTRSIWTFQPGITKYIIWKSSADVGMPIRPVTK